MNEPETRHLSGPELRAYLERLRADEARTRSEPRTSTLLFGPRQVGRTASHHAPRAGAPTPSKSEHGRQSVRVLPPPRAIEDPLLDAVTTVYRRPAELPAMRPRGRELGALCLFVGGAALLALTWLGLCWLCSSPGEMGTQRAPISPATNGRP